MSKPNRNNFSGSDFLAAAYFAVGWTSEGSLYGKERAYRLSFAGTEGKILSPIDNSSYSMGVIQTDLGQHPDVAKRLVERFQMWAEKNHPNLKFEQKEVPLFIKELSRTGIDINREGGRPLNPKIKPALNEFLKSKEGIDFVHAHDVKQIGELHQKIFEPLTRSPAYKNSSYEDQLKLSVALAKLANIGGFNGTRKFMENIFRNKDGKFDNFQEVYEQIKQSQWRDNLSDINHALQGAKVFIALEKSNPNIPLHQAWDAIRPLALANPNNFSGEAKRQRDEIKALFINPDRGLAAIRKQQAEFESKAPENHQADANLPKGSETVAGAFRINTALAGKLSPDSDDGPDNGWNNGPGSGGSFEM